VTPKEKAKELVSKFNFEHTGETYILHQTVDESKRCALIAVDEIILEMDSVMLPNPFKQYWQEIKKEIQML
jgi:hypothetical protein